MYYKQIDVPAEIIKGAVSLADAVQWEVCGADVVAIAEAAERLAVQLRALRQDVD
jgi:hypothetical protein